MFISFLNLLIGKEQYLKKSLNELKLLFILYFLFKNFLSHKLYQSTLRKILYSLYILIASDFNSSFISKSFLIKISSFFIKFFIYNNYD